MIEIKLTLVCNRCKRHFACPTLRWDVMFRRDLEELRALASLRGWRRFRPRNTAPNGDYCPDCVTTLADEKREAKAR